MFVALLWETFERAEESEISVQARRMMLVRSFLTLGVFTVAMVLSVKFPLRLGAGVLLFGLLSPAGRSERRRSRYQDFRKLRVPWRRRVCNPNKPNK
jgi:hypothetical protein